MPKLSRFVLDLVPELFVQLCGNATASVLPDTVQRNIAKGAIEAALTLEAALKDANEGEAEHADVVESRELSRKQRAAAGDILERARELAPRMLERIAADLDRPPFVMPPMPPAGEPVVAPTEDPKPEAPPVS